jgi:hypothetical protein
MIMTLSLLVYSIAQRRMRASIEKANNTIPNPINIPTATPTLRWVFQCSEGINLVQNEETYYKTSVYLDEFDKIRTRIINLIGGHVASFLCLLSPLSPTAILSWSGLALSTLSSIRSNNTMFLHHLQ